MHVIVAMARHGHPPRLRGVLVLSVIASRLHQIPAIGFDQGNHFPHLD
jgi:hypothetical protein